MTAEYAKYTEMENRMATGNGSNPARLAAIGQDHGLRPFFGTPRKKLANRLEKTQTLSSCPVEICERRVKYYG
jgi:hypothetical protein